MWYVNVVPQVAYCPFYFDVILLDISLVFSPDAYSFFISQVESCFSWKTYSEQMIKSIEEYIEFVTFIIANFIFFSKHSSHCVTIHWYVLLIWLTNFSKCNHLESRKSVIFDFATQQIISVGNILGPQHLSVE